MTLFNDYGYVKLSYSTGTSRGRDSYGYTIVRLKDEVTGKVYRTCGGGYDMWGTVFGRWVSDVLQTELKAYLQRQGMKDGDYASGGDMARENGWHYGCGISDKGLAFIDGMTGDRNVEILLRGLGYQVEVSRDVPKRGEYFGKFKGVFVSKIDEN